MVPLRYCPAISRGTNRRAKPGLDPAVGVLDDGLLEICRWKYIRTEIDMLGSELSYVLLDCRLTVEDDIIGHV